MPPQQTSPSHPTKITVAKKFNKRTSDAHVNVPTEEEIQTVQDDIEGVLKQLETEGTHLPVLATVAQEAFEPVWFTVLVMSHLPWDLGLALSSPENKMLVSTTLLNLPFF